MLDISGTSEPGMYIHVPVRSYFLNDKAARATLKQCTIKDGTDCLP